VQVRIIAMKADSSKAYSRKIADFLLYSFFKCVFHQLKTKLQ